MNPADYSSQNNVSIISSNNESTLPSTQDSIYLVGINSNDVYKQLQKAKYNVVSNETNKAVIEGFDTTPCIGDACFTQIGNNFIDVSNNFTKFSKNKNDIINGYTDLSNNIDSYNKELNNYTNGEDKRTYTQRLLDKTPTLKEARRDDTEKLFEQEKIFYAIGSITAVSLLIGAILLAKK
jgi:hypothetical protein